ncbi:MAG: helix-turn-helix transcriptional regulator [Bacilli bacterium]|nr:helix-turn-helix transcriptional regulator [Bacilli bacterium]
METFNSYIYNLRQKVGLNRKDAARLIGISKLALRLYEEGYILPRARAVDKLQRFYNEDFSQYLIKERTYPNPSAVKKEKKSFFYKFNSWLAKPSTRVLVFVFALIFTLCIPGGLFVNDYNNKYASSYYGNKYVQLRDSVIKSGTFTTDIIGSPNAREVHLSNEFDDLTAIIFSSGLDSYYTSKFQFNFRINGRISWTIGSYFSAMDATMLYYSEDTKTTYISHCVLRENESPLLKKVDKIGSKEALTQDEIDINDALASETYPMAIESLGELVDYTIGSDTPIDFYHDILVAKQNGGRINRGVAFTSYAMIYILGVIGIALFGMLVYSFVWYKKPSIIYNEANPLFDHKKERSELPSDIRFAPLIPETVLSIIGIVFLLLGALRFVTLLGVGISSTSQLGIQQHQTLTILSQVGEIMFFFGMFILNLLDFDIFMRDKRMMRSIITFIFTYGIIGMVECLLIYQFNVLGLEVAEFALQYLPGNLFGVMSCHLILMYFLYYTPKWKKNKSWKTILWRLLAILPVAVIFISYFLGNGSRVLLGLPLNSYARAFLPRKWLPFSVLAVLYIVSTYFLKLHYQRKYGLENANKFFNGNRYAFMKNLVACGAIVFIGIIELLFLRNNYAHTWGIGTHPWIFLLIPIVFMYHPHVGERNERFDLIMQYVYLAALSVSYLFMGIVFLITSSVH